MFVYVIKRLVAMAVTLLGITLVTFTIVQAAPGDPVAASMGKADGSGGTSGDAGARDRREDAIKTKRKLLGMLKEDYAVWTWRVEPSLHHNVPKSSSAAPPPVERTETLGEFAKWARALAVTPRGDRLFAGTADNRIHVLDASTGEEARVLGGHAGEIWALAVSPDGATLASADSEGQLRFSSIADGRPVAPPTSLGKSIRALVWLSTERVASACDDGFVRVHEAPSGKVISTFADHTSFVGGLALSKDGTTLWSAGADRKVRAWDLAAGRMTGVLGSAGAAVRQLALSPSGTLLAAACDDRRVYVFPLPGGEPKILEGSWKAVTTVAWAPDSRTLFSGGKDEVIRSWDALEGRMLTQSPEKAGSVAALLVSPDGRTLWSAAESWRKVPVYTQYWNWLSRVARLDFDRSFRDDLRVIDKIKDALPVTLGLNAIAIFLIYVISIPIGVTAAVHRNSKFDVVSSFVVFLLYSMPSFWVATLLIMGFSSERNLNWFDCVGLHSPTQGDLAYLPWLRDWASHLVLPITVLVYGSFASLSRYARTTMLETISQDYVRTARAKGLGERVVIYKHALRNSMITIITLVASLLPAMIGGSVIVETIFSIDGMGYLGFSAILDRDYPVIMATTTFSAFLTLLGVLVSDILYVVVDPRISHE